ncbi:MAG TPA: Smr/MutS family protein [Terriglobia bacterium]|nr:Smr/MutS family protein [Terriglobia bacterium]
MHKPFQALETLVREGRIRLAPNVAPGPRQDLPPLPDGLSDDELFLHAVQDVTALGWSNTPLHPRPPMELPQQDDENDALQALEEFIRHGSVDLQHSDEYIEGAGRPEGRLLLDDLRSGRFSVQAYLDLHGMTREDARFALDEFILSSIRMGFGCVRVIHGRGRHSDKSEPVLKGSLRRWLTTRRLGRHVVAFTSARRCDGGGGAVYVLLAR